MSPSGKSRMENQTQVIQSNWQFKPLNLFWSAGLLIAFTVKLGNLCGCGEDFQGKSSRPLPSGSVSNKSVAPLINKMVVGTSQAVPAGAPGRGDQRPSVTEYQLDMSMSEQQYKTISNDLVDKASRWESNFDKAVDKKKKLAEMFASGQSRLDEITRTKNAHEASKPTVIDRASRLTIGEFESEEAFSKRKAETKLMDAKENKAAVEAWTQRSAALTANLRQAQAAREKEKSAFELEIKEAQAEIVSNYWVSPRFPKLSVIYQAKEAPLPIFDRASMAFDPVVLPKNLVLEFVGTGTPLKMAMAVDPYPTSFRVKFKSLEEARKFKEQYESGQYNCRVTRCLDIQNTESPILIQKEVTKEEETYLTNRNAGNLLGAFIIGALGGAMGASPEAIQRAGESYASDPNFQVKPEKKTVIVQPEKKVDGTRYHFGMTPIDIGFVDSKGSKIDAVVERKANPAVIDDIAKDSPLVPAGIVAGDKVVRVGDMQIHDATSLRFALRSYLRGEKINVVFMKSGTGKEVTISVEGGQPLGLSVPK